MRLLRWLLVCVLLAASLIAHAETIYGIAFGSTLSVFDSANASSPFGIAITGLQPAETVLGLDFRPLNEELYALGSTGRLYTLNVTTAAATLVAPLAADPGDFTNAFTSLNGTLFGFDFDPVTDRIRVVSDTGQNLRVDSVSGLVATDTDLNPGTPNLVAAAYSNNVASSAVTTLYTIDATANALFIQNPANDGTEVLVGPLGLEAESAIGFDISPGGSAFATISVGGTSFFCSVNLATGAATILDTVGIGVVPIDSITALHGGTISFSSASYTVAEGNGTATVTVSRDGGASATTSVTFRTGNGTATSPADFANSNQIVTFLPGETVKNVSIPIVSDAIDETNETVLLALADPSASAVLGSPSSAQLVIVDDDEPADLSIGKAASPPNVPQGGNAVFTITVTNDGPGAATNVVVTDPLPASFTFVSATPSQGSCSGTTTVTCTLGTLNAGSSATVTITTTATGGPGAYGNTATVTAAESDPQSSDNSTTTPVTILGAADVPTLHPFMLLLLMAMIAGVALLRSR